MFTKVFWRDAAERAVATAAQASLAVVGADWFNLLQVDFAAVLGTAAGGAFLSLLKALAARKIGDQESASLDPKLTVDLPGRHAAG